MDTVRFFDTLFVFPIKFVWITEIDWCNENVRIEKYNAPIIFKQAFSKKIFINLIYLATLWIKNIFQFSHHVLMLQGT